MARGSSGQDPRFFKRGILLDTSAEDDGPNAGLGRRERRALSRENSRPYGLTGPAEHEVKSRGRDAQAAGLRARLGRR